MLNNDRYYLPPMGDPEPIPPVPDASFPNLVTEPSVDVWNQIGHNVTISVGCRVREYFGEWMPVPPTDTPLVAWRQIHLIGKKLILEDGLSPAKLVEAKILKRIEAPVNLPEFDQPQEPQAAQLSPTIPLSADVLDPTIKLFPSAVYPTEVPQLAADETQLTVCKSCKSNESADAPKKR